MPWKENSVPSSVRRLAGEPQTAFFHPSVLPMCPVRCVTYVSGRSSSVFGPTHWLRFGMPFNLLAPEFWRVLPQARLPI